MKKLVFFACILLIVACKSQAVLEKQDQVFYTYDSQGELGSCTLFPDKIVFKSPMNSESEKSLTTMTIIKRFDSQHLLLFNERSGQPYGVVSVYTTDDNILKMNRVFSAKTAEEAERKWNEEEAPSWIALTERDLYPKSMIDQMENAPGLDEIKRDDLIAAMQWRKPLSKMLQAYLEDTEGKRSFMVYRFVENYRNRRLVQMGYNPYKQVVYNFEKRFEGDAEILKLLNEEIKF